MGMFAIRKTPASGPEARVASQIGSIGMGVPAARAVPARFEAVGEALASGSSGVAASASTGRDLARDGISLIECLEDLQRTYHCVLGLEPAYDDVLALSQAWSEATLGYLHQISCADPMTGLTTMSHLRTRLADLYRVQESVRNRVRRTHALVVAELASDMTSGTRRLDVLTSPLRLARVGEAARTVFPDADTVAGVGMHRVVVLGTRDPNLGRRASLLRRMVESPDLHGRRTRVWIEGLPPGEAGAVSLLDELARD